MNSRLTEEERIWPPGPSIGNWVAKHGVETGFATLGLGDHCPHEPGTPEKVAEIISRIEQGYEIWHPLDPQDFSKSPPGRIKPTYRTTYDSEFEPKDGKNKDWGFNPDDYDGDWENY